MRDKQVEQFRSEFKALCTKHGVDDFLLAHKQNGFVYQTREATFEIMVPTFFTLLTTMQAVFEGETKEVK